MIIWYGLCVFADCPLVTQQERMYVSLFPASPHMYTHQNLFCLPNIQPSRLFWLRNWRWLTLVDLFMRWSSILALGTSLRLASYSLCILTTFVVFINITFWHPDRYALPEDSSKIKFSTSTKYSSNFVLTLTGRLIFFFSVEMRSLLFHLCFFMALCTKCMNQSQIGLVSVYLEFRASFDLLGFDLIGRARKKASCSGDK